MCWLWDVCVIGMSWYVGSADMARTTDIQHWDNHYNNHADPFERSMCRTQSWFNYAIRWIRWRFFDGAIAMVPSLPLWIRRWLCELHHFGTGSCWGAHKKGSKQAPFSVALCYKSFRPTPTAGGVRVASSDGCGRFLQAATKFNCLRWSGNHLVTIW